MTEKSQAGSGPLAGTRVLEFAGIGPGPHAAMLLADLGAQVIRIEREGGNGYPNPLVDRGRITKVCDITGDEGRNWCLEAISNADVLLEGMRPGVMERLGLGPEPCMKRNPRLVYGRITGWGQTGPMSQMAGHDINYIGLTGALAAMGRPGEPAAIPLNLVGDFGGGSMFLLLGILAALVERQSTGKGQVVDAAIVDGTASLMSFFYGLAQTGQISLDREQNLLGGAAPFYRTYPCADGKEIAVGALEPKFFRALVEKLGTPELAQIQYDRTRWPEIASRFEKIIQEKDRDEWARIFDGSDCCVTPVLDRTEVAGHPHMKARGICGNGKGVTDLPPMPRLSGHDANSAELKSSLDADAVLAQWSAA